MLIDPERVETEAKTERRARDLRMWIESAQGETLSAIGVRYSLTREGVRQALLRIDASIKATIDSGVAPTKLAKHLGVDVSIIERINRHG